MAVEDVPKASRKLACVGDFHPADLVREVGIVVVSDEDGTDLLSVVFVLAIEVTVRPLVRVAFGVQFRGTRTVVASVRC